MRMVTPMMQQYLDIKRQYSDAILFYRLGDFYEMFYDDAVIASKELELTLTGRNCGEDERAPMCGVPFHAADMYIGKLVSRGYKVVVCEQMEDPATAKGLVKRDIVRVVTPGTVIDNNQLAEEKNNYLCAVYMSEGHAGIGFADVSTGDVFATAIDGEDYITRLLNEINTFSPSELLLNVQREEYPALDGFMKSRGIYCGKVMPERFDFKKASEAIEGKTEGDESAASDRGAVCAVGALIAYIHETQLTDVGNITRINFYTVGQYLELDASSRRNLELCETMRTREKKGSLLGVLDATKTASGARLLRKWIEQPLLNVRKITGRQKAVGELASDYIMREDLAELLKRVLDLDRLITKAVYGTANARDLLAISATAAVLPEIKSRTGNCKSGELKTIHDTLDTLDDLRELIDKAICDDPPATVREGGYIRRGYNERADELFTIVHDGKSYINRIAAEEREKTGIKNLKISYNRVFGYYIEVTKSFLSEVPERYIRRQTLANAERFVTEELKEKENLILGASDKLIALEYELFTALREKLASNAGRIQRTAALIAELDVYISLAEAASKNNYCCPEVEYGDVIQIKEGRHPVVEKFAENGYFVPNDTYLDTNHNRLALITGPNMAGKSTYMRQVALITLMAQIGSFVPAKEARIGIVDKIFTRVGASDDLASGQSTFMLEMTEVAQILKNATKRSLIIYDEIGRGTSTYDGMSIARAVAEYTAGKKLGAKALFATHYHELTSLEKELDGVVNYNIAAKKKGDSITFFRRIVRGAADESYGIEVAKLAGVPQEVIKRAKEILKELNLQQSSLQPRTKAEPSENISIDDYKAVEVRERLLNTDLNIMTPLDALNLLTELQKAAR
ncbi:MAG: DNA mismatch repair protein MutS [Firmicutes bacterium]|nr:DNA mismatch repair protein MutS [Bacillota bacterium]